MFLGPPDSPLEFVKQTVSTKHLDRVGVYYIGYCQGNGEFAQIALVG